MNSDPNGKLLIDILLKEYDKLKTEQFQRIAHRDNLAYATFIATAAITTFALKADGKVHALLALPFICFALGWSHLNNDHKITAIGCYIGKVLRVRMAALTGNPESVFAWELGVRKRKGRRIEKLITLLANGITFIAPGAAAICAFYYLHPVLNYIFVGLIIGGLFVLGILAVALWLASDIAGVSHGNPAIEASVNLTRDVQNIINSHESGSNSAAS